MRLFEKQTSMACSVWSGLNNTFHWKAHLLIKFRLSLSLRFGCFLIFDLWKKWCVIRKKLVNLYVNTILSGKWFIYFENRSGPKTEPWGTPAKIFSPREFVYLKELLVYVLFSHFLIILKGYLLFHKTVI